MKQKFEFFFKFSKSLWNDLHWKKMDPDDPFFSSADPGSGSASKLNGSLAQLEWFQKGSLINI